MTEPARGWGIRVNTGRGWRLVNNIFWTRTEAIADYNSIYRKPNQYHRDRKAGRALAVRVTLTEDQSQ